MTFEKIFENCNSEEIQNLKKHLEKGKKTINLFNKLIDDRETLEQLLIGQVENPTSLEGVDDILEVSRKADSLFVNYIKNQLIKKMREGQDVHTETEAFNQLLYTIKQCTDVQAPLIKQSQDHKKLDLDKRNVENLVEKLLTQISSREITDKN
jgi:hypothetical protein